MRKKAISIAFINNKSGVGKTTTNVVLACLLASPGKKRSCRTATRRGTLP